MEENEKNIQIERNVRDELFYKLVANTTTPEECLLFYSVVREHIARVGGGRSIDNSISHAKEIYNMITKEEDPTVKTTLTDYFTKGELAEGYEYLSEVKRKRKILSEADETNNPDLKRFVDRYMKERHIEKAEEMVYKYSFLKRNCPKIFEKFIQDEIKKGKKSMPLPMALKTAMTEQRKKCNVKKQPGEYF